MNIFIVKYSLMIISIIIKIVSKTSLSIREIFDTIYNIRIEFRILDSDIGGLYLFNEKIILVNYNYSLFKQGFILVHEMTHAIQDKTQDISQGYIHYSLVTEEKYRNQRIEIEANKAASFGYIFGMITIKFLKNILGI